MTAIYTRDRSKIQWGNWDDLPHEYPDTIEDRIESLNALSGALAEIEKNFGDFAKEVESHLWRFLKKARPWWKANYFFNTSISPLLEKFFLL